MCKGYLVIVRRLLEVNPWVTLVIMSPDPRKHEARLAAIARAYTRAVDATRRNDDLVEAFEQASALRDLLGRLEQGAKMLRSEIAAQIQNNDLLTLAAVARRVGITAQRLNQLAQEGRRPSSPQPVSEPSMTAEPQPIVAAIVTSDRGLLVTYRRDKTPPAGFLTGEVEPGESAADAMVRECKEEAGLRVIAGLELGRRVHPRTGRLVIYVAGTPVEDAEVDVFVGDEEELSDVRWITLAEADAAFAPFGGMFKPVHDYLLGRPKG